MSLWSTPAALSASPVLATGTGRSVTWTGTISAGSAIVAIVYGGDTSGTQPTVTDSAGNTYTPVRGQVNTGGSGASEYVLVAQAKADATGLVITSSLPSSKNGLVIAVASPGAGASVVVEASGSTNTGQHMKLAAPLTWTPGIIGLDLIVALGQDFATGTVTAANGTTLLYQGVTSFQNPAVYIGYTLNDQSGSANPELDFQNGTFGAVVSVVLGAVDATNQLYVNGPTSGVAGLPIAAPYQVRLGNTSASNVTVNIASDGSGDVLSATSGGSAVTSITIPAGSALGTFYLKPGAAGTRHVSISAAGYTVNGSPIAVAAQAVPVGSAHSVGQCLLAHTGGATGAIGGATAATIAFRFEAMSAAAGLASAAGTTVVDWGTGANLATYYPASNTMILALNGSSGGFSATVPIQVGVGYHFALTAAVGAQPNFTGTITNGNYNITGIADTSVLMVGDLIAGAGIPTGTTIVSIVNSTTINTSSPATASATESIAVTRGLYTLYMNGVAYSTQNIPHPTFGYSQVRVGGDAGAGIALDHRVSDLCAYGSHTATAAEVLALAQGTSLPPQIGGAPAYWFMLGGGTSGTTPGLGDFSLSDLTGNGNTLSVATGSLSGLAYAGSVGVGSPALLSAYASKCGKLAVFGATATNAGTSGKPPVAPITAIPGTPTIHCQFGGTGSAQAVQIGPPTWLSSTQDSPFITYLLQCGSVIDVAIADGGAGYTSPVVTAPGVTFGTPVLQSGVTGFTFTGGQYYGSTPTLTIAAPAGYNASATSPTRAAAVATMAGGSVTSVALKAGGVPGCGSGYSAGSPPAVTVSGGFGSGATFTVTLSGSGLGSIAVAKGGSGYPPSTTIPLVITDGTGSGGAATCTTNGSGVVTSAAVTTAGTGYSPVSVTGTTAVGSKTVSGIASTTGLVAGMAVAGTGIPANATISSVTATTIVLSAAATAAGTVTITASLTVAPQQVPATVTAIVSNYIAYVPVTSGGSSLTAPPTITVTDGGGTPSRAASLSCLMSGVAPADVLTYDSPAAWITPVLSGHALGGIQAVTGRAMDNWSGRREGVSGGLSAFAQTPTLIAGANVGSQPLNPAWPFYTAKNALHRTIWAAQGSSPGALTTSAGGTPVSWTFPTTTTLNGWSDGPFGDNPIDGMGWAGRFGPWTLRYDDPNVNTPAAMALWITGGQSRTGVNLSGDGTATATATLSGGAVASLTITHGGTGYQGAIAVLTGGGGGSSAFTLQCSGGVVTGATKLCGGSGYTSAPTVTIYGTAVSGNTTTIVTDLEPGSSPTTWQVNAAINAASPAGAGGLGYWTASNVWFVAPDLTTRQAVTSIDPSKPYATDDGVLGMLTSPSGKSVGVLRYMDVSSGYGNDSNWILPTDLQDPTLDSWSIHSDPSVHFQYARYFNTDPASPTYSWSSPKYYGVQAECTGQDAPFTITATVTAGSTALTNLVGNALMTGSAVSGPGIPAGTYIASLSGATGATLSAAATASGAGVTLTIASPGYFSLPPSDAGSFVAPGTSNACVVLELRSTTPHGLLTGQNGTIFSPPVNNASAGNPIPITNGTPYIPYPGPNSSQLWVTGPYTVAVACYIPSNINAGVAGGGNPQVVASTTEVDLTVGGAAPNGWSIDVKVPYGGNGCMPFEYAASMVAQLPGCAYWLNIPVAASNALIQHIAQATAAHIGPTNEIWLEYYNEIWNGTAQQQAYFGSMAQLLGYVPAGTTVLNYYTSDGTKPPYANYSSSIVLTAHAQDVFIAAFQAAGGDPSKVKRLQGSWYHGPFRTQQINETAARYGVPVDHSHVGPYLLIPGDAPLVTAYSPAGSAAGAGSWPADAINDFFRHWMAYSSTVQSLLGGHALSCLNFGQPQANGSSFMFGGVANTSPASGGGLPATASLSCCYTFSDGQGRETTIGLSRSSCAIASGDVPSLSMPQWPSWAQQLNIYLTAGAQGTETLYTTVPRSQYGGGNTYPVGAHVPLSSGTWANPSQKPPATNHAAVNNPSSPSMVCYEGGATNGVPTSIPFATLLQHDVMWHPSARDVSWGWYAAMQQGQQEIAGGGMTAACYYQLYGEGYGANIWAMAHGSAMPAGDGLGHAYTGAAQVTVPANQYALVQGGYPADAHNHVGGAPGNAAPMLAGLRDFFDTAGPVAPTVTATVPVTGAVRVTTNTNIAVTYSEAMDSTTLTLSLSPGAIACTLSGYNAGTLTATFDPVAALAHGTTYTAIANGTGSGGIPMVADQWSFTAIDAAPSVVSVTPANGNGGVATGIAPAATLAGAASATVSMTAGGSSVAGTSSFSGGVATFTPTSSLPLLTACTVTVNAAAADGTAMSPYSWGFTTQANVPSVSAVTPTSGATMVEPFAVISATFSEAIDPLSLGLTLSPSAMIAAPTWDAGTLTATWTPIGAGLPYATSFQATVSAKAVDGTTMTAPYEWSFATHQAPPTGGAVVGAPGCQFPSAATIDATNLAITVTDVTTGQPVAGTATFDATTKAVRFTPTSPLSPAKEYRMVISGLKSGTQAVGSVTIPISPTAQRTGSWQGGLGRATTTS